MSEHKPDKTFAERLLEVAFIALQYVLPHHLLSSLMHRLARSESRDVKNFLIRQAINWYNIDLDDALEQKPGAYRSFNHFFTRDLKVGARPIARLKKQIACPADGTLSVAGTIEAGRLLQAKGYDYSLTDLLGGDLEWSEQFEDGRFATIYLSPRDYHRVHMPYTGILQKMIHVPGRLFSVNQATTEHVPRLFARNERVVSLFETEIGPLAVIMVGAIFVSSIDTVWAGTVTPHSQQSSSWDYVPSASPLPVKLKKGAEMGRFNMGSTVIIVFGKDAVAWSESLEPGQSLKMGQAIAQTKLATSSKKKR